MTYKLLFVFVGLILLPSVSAEWNPDYDINASLSNASLNFTDPCYFQLDGTDYIISGNLSGTFAGFNMTGGVWKTDNNIISGLQDVGLLSSPTCFFGDETLYLISGANDGLYPAYNWTGTAWQRDSNVNASLLDMGDKSKPNVFITDGTRYLFSHCCSGKTPAYNWTGTAWQVDYAINASIADVVDWSYPYVFYKDGTLYAFIGSRTNEIAGYNKSSGLWVADGNIVSGLLASLSNVAPNVFLKDGKLQLIYGQFPNGFGGWLWNESTTPTVTINSPSGTTTNTTITLNATSTDNCINWYNNSELIITCDTPINSTQLVGHWKLGEGNGNSWISNGNATDSSGNNNHGTINGAEYVQGRFEKGLSFDGVDDYVNADGVVNEVAGSLAGAFSFWVKPNIITGSGHVLSFGDTDANERLVTYKNGQKSTTILTDAGTNEWVLDSVSNVFTIGVWSYVVITHNGTAPSLYIDGIKVTQTFSTSNDLTAWANNLTGIDNFRIGDRNFNTGVESLFFNGTIDEVRIYNRSLSATEILDEYNLANGYYNWTPPDIETLYVIGVNASDSYINVSATASLSVDYSVVTILNETDGAAIDENMNIKMFNFDTFEELATAVGTTVTFKNIDELSGLKIAVRASNSSSSNFAVPREIAKIYSPGTDFIIYLPKTSVETVGFHQFKIQDFTEDWGGSNVIFKRDISGTLTTIHETFVDVENKAVVYLIKDIEYQITANKSDITRVFGFYKATHNSITSVLEVDLNMVNITEWTDRAYLNKDINFTVFQNGTNIFFAYDNIGSTSTIEWWVFNGSNKSQQLFYASANGSSSAIFTYAPPDANETHFSYFCANNSIYGFFCKWDTPKAVLAYDWLIFGGPRIPTWAPTAVAMVIILVIAGTFGGVDSKSGALMVAGSSVLFYYIGWLDLGSPTQGGAILGLVVFMAVLNKLTEGAQ